MENRCVSCGSVIPEGRQVCPNCMKSAFTKDRKKMDKLAWENERALACGMSYGKWKAMQEPVKIENTIPDGWKRCPQCGKPFKPRCGQKYCDAYCRTQAYKPREREIFRKYMNGYRERKGAANVK